MLNHDYIKDNYRLIAVNLSKQKELGCWSESNSAIELNQQLNASDAGNDQSIFVLKFLEEIKDTRLKFSGGNVTVL